MKRFALVLLMAATAVTAQDTTKKSATDAMMEMYVELAKPVDSHARLSALAGRWNMTTRLWFDPKDEPRVATGTATGKMILGGRFLQLDATVKGGGIDSDSLTILGFDRRTSDYTMIGLDTLGTYYITAAGKHDDGKKTMTLSGSYAQPPTGQEQKYRFALKQVSADEHVWDLFFAMPDGKEMLVAQTTLRRAR